MSRIEKRLEKFCNPNAKQEMPRDDLDSILNHFFPGMWSFGDTRGSHNYRVTHPKFKEYPEYGPEGMLTIPTTGGKKIKYFYLKKLCKAVELIKEYER